MTRTVPRWLVWVAIVIALVAAAGAARWFDPPVITETNVDVKVVKREVVRWRTAKAVDTYTKTTPVLLAGPDGGVIVASIEEHSTRDRSTAEGTSSTDSSSESRTQTTTKLDVKRYRVGAQVGASWLQPAVPIAGPLVVGATVDVRLGNLPVWIGAWGGTYGAAGGSISGEF